MTTVLKQETLLSIDFSSRSVQGTTRLRFLAPEASKLSLFCKQLEILKVWTASGPAAHTYARPADQCQWAHYALNSTLDTNSLLEMTWELWDYETSQNGLLSVSVPSSKLEQTLTISYKLENPAAGLRFFSHNQKEILVAEAVHENKRYWMPCLDAIHHKYPLTLEVMVPKEYYVVASGELAGVIVEDGWRYFQYNANTYLATIGFCAAPIGHIFQDSSNAIVTYFCMGNEKDVMFTTKNSKFDYGEMIRSCAEKMGKPFPFRSQKVVFLPNVGKN
jgi:aminopeptidase N